MAKSTMKIASKWFSIWKFSVSKVPTFTIEVKISDTVDAFNTWIKNNSKPFKSSLFKMHLAKITQQGIMGVIHGSIAIIFYLRPTTASLPRWPHSPAQSICKVARGHFSTVNCPWRHRNDCCCPEYEEASAHLGLFSIRLIQAQTVFLFGLGGGAAGYFGSMLLHPTCSHPHGSGDAATTRVPPPWFKW